MRRADIIVGPTLQPGDAMGRPCPHCKSPAWRNPCWFFLINPEAACSGGDPPCVCDEFAVESIARDRISAGLFYVLATAVMVSVVAGGAASGLFGPSIRAGILVFFGSAG